jgi:magnesium transporter
VTPTNGDVRLDPGAPETAGRHLARRVPTAAPDATAGEAREQLAGERWEATELLCLVGPAGRLEHIVPLARLLAAPRDARLASLALPATPSVSADADQERVASLAIRHGISAIPVTGAAGRLLGVVPAQALLEVLRHEHVEDLQRLAGITRENLQARHAFEAAPLRALRNRLPWLLIGLAGSSLTALLMAGFEAELDARVTLAFFVPGLVYLADAIGTQTEAIVVRGLSLEHGPIRRLLLGELCTGLLLGLVLGALCALGVFGWLHDARLAAAVGIALVAAGAVAATIGFTFPWALARLGRDPALGSGPLATVIQDVLSLAIYFATASWLL